MDDTGTGVNRGLQWGLAMGLALHVVLVVTTWGRVLLMSGEWEPGTLLNTPQHPGPPRNTAV